MKTLKDFLKMILPPPVRTFLREMGELRQLTERQTRLLEQGQRETLKAVERQAGELTRLLAEQAALLEAQSAALKAQTERGEELRQTGAVLTEQAEALRQANEALTARLEKLEQKQQETLGQLACFRTEADKAWEAASSQRKALSEAVEQTRRQSAEGARYASEAVWAETFNNAVSGSAWLKNTAFSPGRWAVGYPALYVMYRVLNEARPKRILELGLGQSTRMIAQYAAAHEDVEHIVVEHDPEWIDFFRNDFALSPRTEILQLDREMAPYKEAEAVRVFRGFREALAGKKFDFIFIDAPLGGDMKQYARIDVLGLLPDCLRENFVIMMDDAGRSGEAHTVAEMVDCLNSHGISAAKGRYSGEKDTILICNRKKGFLTTM